MTLKVLDTFAGIGGFSLGLERTGGFETVAFCEIEPYAQKVLAKHWPGVPIYDDIRELTAERLASDGIGVDVITGGFPCQDISTAGKQAGIEGERSGLWGELARLIGDIRPRYAILENVTNLLSGADGQWFGKVLGDLAKIGYDAEWHCIPASSIGAPHIRDRVWITAYSQRERSPGPRRLINAVDKAPHPYREASGLVHAFQRRALPYVCRRHDGVPSRVDRLRCLGNAVVPQIPELIGRAILDAERRFRAESKLASIVTGIN